MSDPIIERNVRFSREDPSKYDFVEDSHISKAYRQRETLVLRLSTADVKINQASDYSAEIVQAILPVILAKRAVKTVEFISYNRWRKTADEVATLRGVILRDKDARVLLNVYGVGLGGSEPGNIGSFILDSLGVSDDKQKEIYNATWPLIGYSVVIELL